MSSDKLDRHIQDKLYDHETEVDTDALWEAVQPKRRRKTFAWWWLGGVSVALVLAAVVVFLNTNHENAQITSTYTDHAVAISPIEQDDIDFTNPSAVLDAVMNPSVAGSVMKEQDISEWQEKVQKEQKAGEHQNLDQQKDVVQGKLAGPKEHVKENESGKYLDENQTTIASIDQPANQANSSKEETSNKQFAQPENLRIVIPKNKNTPSTQTALEENTEMFTASKASITTIEESAIKEKAIQSTFTNLPTLFFRLDDKTRPLPKPIYVSNPPPSSTKKWQPWSTQVSVGAYKLNRTWTADSSSNNWLVLRESTEEPLEATSLELSLSYQFKNNLQIRSGLEFLQINSRFQSQYSVQTTDSVMGVEAIVIDSLGVAIEIMGMIERYQTVSHNKVTHNSIRQWNIPLLVSYQVNRNAWQFFVEGGIRVNLTQKAEGEIFTPNSTADSQEAGDLSSLVNYKTSIGLSYQMGLGVGYQIAPNMDILLQANTRFYPKNFTESSAGIQEKYQLLGGQLGLRWKF